MGWRLLTSYMLGKYYFGGFTDTLYLQLWWIYRYLVFTTLVDLYIPCIYDFGGFIDTLYLRLWWIYGYLVFTGIICFLGDV